jgi:hypothetical protein
VATPPELGALLRSGVFVPQLHLGALMLAGIRGHIDLSSLASRRLACSSLTAAGAGFGLRGPHLTSIKTGQPGS